MSFNARSRSGFFAKSRWLGDNMGLRRLHGRSIGARVNQITLFKQGSYCIINNYISHKLHITRRSLVSNNI